LQDFRSVAAVVIVVVVVVAVAVAVVIVMFAVVTIAGEWLMGSKVLLY